MFVKQLFFIIFQKQVYRHFFFKKKIEILLEFHPILIFLILSQAL
jgi:hypothetical protein